MQFAETVKRLSFALRDISSTKLSTVLHELLPSDEVERLQELQRLPQIDQITAAVKDAIVHGTVGSCSFTQVWELQVGPISLESAVQFLGSEATEYQALVAIDQLLQLVALCCDATKDVLRYVMQRQNPSVAHLRALVEVEPLMEALQRGNHLSDEQIMQAGLQMTNSSTISRTFDFGHFLRSAYIPCKMRRIRSSGMWTDAFLYDLMCKQVFRHLDLYQRNVGAKDGLPGQLEAVWQAIVKE